MKKIPIEETEAVIESPGSSENGNYVGYYNLTAYPESGNACADGVYPQVGYTAACNDPSLWYHWVYIEGVGERFIHDTGDPAVMGYDTIDIYMGDPAVCWEFGVQGANVYIID